MVKVKNIDDLLAEQAVRKAATCYSRGVDRSDLELLKSAFHDDAEDAELALIYAYYEKED